MKTASSSCLDLAESDILAAWTDRRQCNQLEYLLEMDTMDDYTVYWRSLRFGLLLPA